MSQRKRVLVVFGTRPEAIKMAPVIQRLSEQTERFETLTLVTAQHREMLDQVLRLFDIQPDYDLNIMRHGQSLAALTANALEMLSPVIRDAAPSAVLVQGDTTTTLTGAMAAYFNKVPVAHIEAGLRSDDLYQPFPEEMNRRMVSQLSTWHYAPTTTARARLLGEGFEDASIVVTGNTVVDALLSATEVPYTFPPGPIASAIASGRRILLATAHRRENWGEPLEQVFAALGDIARTMSDVEVLFSVHRNPVVRDAAQRILGDKPHVHLLEPLDYLPFVKLMSSAYLILSDSGGIQEEAPSLGKPVLVLRDVTERPEAISAGTVRLVGTNRDRIISEVTRLMECPDAYSEMARSSNPFGDGSASASIVEDLDCRLG